MPDLSSGDKFQASHLTMPKPALRIGTMATFPGYYLGLRRPYGRFDLHFTQEEDRGSPHRP